MHAGQSNPLAPARPNAEPGLAGPDRREPACQHRARRSCALTIKGGGNYGFLLTSIDGQQSGGGGVDRLRLKIWDRDDADVIIYDDDMGAGDDADPTTVLGGGSIKIHSGGNQGGGNDR